ncbi:zinc ribbon domain-containing protein [Nocardia wallacei]|uniref:zinc ribbon domain-containing protein n=1 Tax=Nocardia wallacei TaxID=480035 RepID=UPI00245512D0|nr:zinc ribbon domain-containing protein [Nocardia wallacei]
MPTCWHCGHELTGSRQRHCTACGSPLCWHCGHAVDDLDRRYCTDCGSLLPRTAPPDQTPRRRRTARLPIAALVPAILVLLVLAVVTGAILARHKSDSQPTADVDRPASTTTWRYPSSIRPQPVTTTLTSTTPALSGPAAVVWNYFDAANRHDYLAAWNLGGHNLDTSYEHFAAGFATTARDKITIGTVTGNQVDVILEATQTDGSHRGYTGYYLVDNGEIVGARMSEQ